MSETTTGARPSPTLSEADTDDAALQAHDTRTGRDYRIDIEDGAIRATALSRILDKEGDGSGLLSYDPAFMNTASCRSAITFIDGDQGILRYRGYPIQELAGTVSFLDVAHLLIHGDLPGTEASRAWAAEVSASAELPAEVARLVETFPPDAHPMAVLLSAWSALAAYRPEVRRVDDTEARRAELPRFFGSMVSLAGLIHRRRTGRPAAGAVAAPSGGLAERLFVELFPEQAPEPTLVAALDIMLVLQADHEQNCSTNAVRSVGSSRVDPYSATSAGIAALFGPLHGGANEAVIHMLHDVGDVNRVEPYIDSVKRGERRLMGFGHRIYKSYDPRARIIKETADRVFAVTGTNPLLDVAVAIERVALADDYFIERRLYPNVDFYSGLIYEAMGIPVEGHTLMFAIARMAGWVAQWLEMIDDPEQKIARPRQIYVGHGARSTPESSRPS